VTDVHADKRNPGSAPLQLPEGHEYVEIDIATKDEVVAAVRQPGQPASQPARQWHSQTTMQLG
jgi:hypothetical protein